MKRYYSAPENVPYENIKTPTIFLAGGITNCWDWQSVVSNKLLELTNLTVINPRRQNFNMSDPLQSEIQIKWEFQNLRLTNYVAFWFPNETLCPITLFELGKELVKRGETIDDRIFVGCDPLYQRITDVKIQCELENFHTIHTSLDDLIEEIVLNHNF